VLHLQVNKQKEEVILDYLHETAFRGSGLGRTILGPEVRTTTTAVNSSRDGDQLIH